MANHILDERDQRFVLKEMLEVESLCTYKKFAEFSGDVFDMVLTEAGKFAQEEVFPTMAEGDRQGCRLENGQVYAPECFHRLYKLFCEGGWNAIDLPVEIGGQGMPVTIANATVDWFIHNFAFLAYPALGKGTSRLIGHFGTEDQKKRYLEKLVSGQWLGTMGLTEPGAGSDVGNLSTRAIRQPDGSFRIQGTKIFHTGADHDLTENIIQPILARIEGDPVGTKGISIFLVPKYIVNDDGSLGRRNDYQIANVEKKMGIHGSATCLVNYGDNGECYAELLGEERSGMKIMFMMMNEMRLGVGTQGLGSASVAYLHALAYAKERLQGSALIDFKNPAAPRVPIIEHPDVRRMLLWMKSHVEGMRAMIYYTGFCLDKSECCETAEERDTWLGLVELLTPVCKAYCSDMGFRVTEYAIQVHGGYGYCSEYPVEQIMRDQKIASVYEGANGIQALDLVARKLGMKKGAYFMNLLGEMNAVVSRYQGVEEIAELTEAVGKAVNTLAGAAMFFARSGKEGNFLVPVNNAYPFLMMMGSILHAWFLMWEAGIASGKLADLSAERGVKRDDAQAWGAFVKDSADAAFYDGKIHAARYYIRNVLPVSLATMTAIESADMSIITISNTSF